MHSTHHERHPLIAKGGHLGQAYFTIFYPEKNYQIVG